MYLPESWLTPEQRTRARIPARVACQPKWQLALTLLRQVRASGITVTAVLGDAEFGESATLRRTLHRAQLPYALGVSSTLTVFRRHARPRRARRRARHRAPALAPARWRPTCRPSRRAPGPRRSPPARGAWCRGATARIPPWRARFCATRVTPAHDWRDRRLAPEVWLLCERALGASDRTKSYLVHLPATASLRTLGAAHASALGDRAAVSGAEGRTRPRSLRRPLACPAGSATSSSPRSRTRWLQCERHRRGTHLPTLPLVRAVITEILTAHFFVTRPHYLHTMQKLAEIDLRI